MTTQQDERLELIQFAKDHAVGGSEFNRKMTKIAALLQADAEVGGEAAGRVNMWTEDGHAKWSFEPSDAAWHLPYFGQEARERGVKLSFLVYTHPQQAARVPPEIQAVIEAARQWWCDRAPQNWDDAELAKAVIRLDGDWPGCPGCDHECDEPCMPATMQEQLHAVDCHVAQLVHEGKLHPGDDYTPPTGWEPKPYPKKAAHGIGKDQG